MSNAFEKYGSSSIESVEVSNSAPMFKVKADTTFRIGFPLINQNGTVSIIPLKHFASEDKSGTFRAIRVTDKLEADKEVMEMLYSELGEPKTRWVTVVMQYETNTDGKVSKPCTGTLKGVKLSKKDVQALKAINNSTKIALADFYVTTDNEQMQAKLFTAITKEGQPHALWKNDKVNEIDKEADGDEVEVKGIWEADKITEEAWELIEGVMDSIAREMEPKAVVALLKGEDKTGDGDDDNDDDEWDDAEVQAKPKTKTSKKNKEELDDLEELD